MRILAAIAVTAAPAWGDSLIATRTVRAQSIIAAEDIAMVQADIPGALTGPDLAVGMEARVTLYAGRPLHDADIGPPALVKRNQMVTLVFQTNGLTIHTAGRALERGAEGDLIHVMNLSSHLTIQGLVGPDASVSVGPKEKG